MLKKLISFTSGKKTYAIVIIGVIVNGLFAMGYIPNEYLPVVNIILGFLGLGALRKAIK